MSCAEEFGRFERELIKFIESQADLTILTHECEFHGQRCDEIGGMIDEVRINQDALREAVTQLSRCIETLARR